jgi:hypothetical protein
MGHESVVALEVGEESAGLGAGKDDRNLGRPFDSLDLVNEIEFAVEHLLVKKQECGQGLVSGRSGDVFVDCKMGKEPGDLFLAHFVRVPLTVKKDIAANPIDIGLLGSDAVMFDA